MTALPTWVQWLDALSTTAIALAGIIIALSNLWLSFKKRKDSLFDRRFEFYTRAASAWSNVAEQDGFNRDTLPDWDERALLSIEARFLFGPEIAKHLATYDKPFHPYESHVPNEDFVKPFEKFLGVGSRRSSDA